MTCAICYEDMDMLEYNDPNDSTNTCFKLGCGHSYHTKCIVMFLTNTHHKCPTCNRVKTVDAELELHGKCIGLIKDSMKAPDFREIYSEYKIAKNDYKKVISDIKLDVKKLLIEKSKEYKLSEHRVYFLECKKAVKSVVRTHILENSNKHVAAYYYSKNQPQSTTLGDLIVFHGGSRSSLWNAWRLLHPRIYINIPFLIKDLNGHDNAPDNSSDSNSVHSLI